MNTAPLYINIIQQHKRKWEDEEKNEENYCKNLLPLEYGGGKVASGWVARDTKKHFMTKIYRKRGRNLVSTVSHT